MKNLDEKTVLITGAASGIGRALACKFNRMGSKVIIIDVNKAGLITTESLCSNKENYFEYVMDISKQENWNNLHSYLKERELVPDIIINNAGRAMSDVSIKDICPEDFNNIFNTNFWGTFWGTKEFLPDLLDKKGETAIINFSSIYGITACGWACAYSTSKFAVRGFTDTLRQELKNTNILVACVYPGGTKTGIARNAVLAKGTELTAEKIQMAINFEETCLTTPEQAADIIIKGISKNKKRILTGKDAKTMDFIARLRPVHYDNFMFETVLKGKNNKSA